jgi:hypothetical protein
MSWLGDSECDSECFNVDCLFDKGDCTNDVCNATCTKDMMNDGVCQE